MKQSFVMVCVCVCVCVCVRCTGVCLVRTSVFVIFSNKKRSKMLITSIRICP